MLDLPRGYSEGNAAMMLSACHGKPIVQGETSRRMGLTLADRLQTRDLAAQQPPTGRRARQIYRAAPPARAVVPLERGGRRSGRYTKAAYQTVRDSDSLTVLRVY